ncbi:MAG TPA: CHAD domain-containing protein, partial [Blastocatellia bacterium]
MAEAEARLTGDGGTVAPQTEGDPPGHSSGHPPCPREIISHQLHTLAKHHGGVIETGGVESIHRMRVATRKLQATLDMLVMKPDELGIKDRKKELRDWRRQLSRVRNYDVFLEMIEKRTSAKKPVNLSQYKLIEDELKHRRSEIVLEVQEALREIDLAGFASKVGVRLGVLAPDGHQKVDQSDETQPSPDERALLLLDDSAAIAARAKRRLERRLREFEDRAAVVGPKDSPNDIHQLRIAAKRLRYSMDVVSNLGYGKAERATNWLKRLQDRLGEIHDIDAFAEEIADLIGRRDYIRQQMSNSGKMLEAASRIIAKRDNMVKTSLPVHVPSYVSSTVRRLTRKLESAAHSKTGKH